jgi:vacuolar-type H+-ATPase subunit H
MALTEPSRYLTPEQNLDLIQRTHDAEEALEGYLESAERVYRRAIREAKNDREENIDAARMAHRTRIASIQRQLFKLESEARAARLEER